mmetsp:Transcript_47476/g.133595  ORF Transcript_47476/g.133595 Transcript_47476/m.133595 type:complete len:284 (+) Transcript_47476:101-952(+)
MPMLAVMPMRNSERFASEPFLATERAPRHTGRHGAAARQIAAEAMVLEPGPDVSQAIKLPLTAIDGPPPPGLRGVSLGDVRKVPMPSWIRHYAPLEASLPTLLAPSQPPEDNWTAAQHQGAYDARPVDAPLPPPPRAAVPRAARGSLPPPKFVVSVGSVGHPESCGGICQAEVCEQGTACQKCHLCMSDEKAQAETASQEDAQSVYSVGSIGHPATCAEACKFHTKPRGCKDGAMCVRCHVCRWSRYAKRSPLRAGSGWASSLAVDSLPDGGVAKHLGGCVKG